MLCAEWWAFEILTILSGIIGVNEQAANVVAFNVLAQVFMIPLGMQEASCAIIGIEIGANNVPLAKRYASVISTIAFCTIIGIALLLYYFSVSIAALFSEDPDVFNLTIKAIQILAILHLADGGQGYM